MTDGAAGPTGRRFRMDVKAAMIRRITGLTLVLGATVVVAWLAVRSLSVFAGPGPDLDRTWFVVWAVQAALACVVGFVVGRSWGRDTSRRTLLLVVLAAWLGELLVVSVIAPFLADELTLLHGPWLWLVAAGGPLQPLAVLAGVLVGAALVPARPPSPG